jgi:hypothetical protein
MASHIGIVNSIYAFGKRLLSYRKLDWILSDYPVRTRTQKFDPELNSKRFTQHRFFSYIVNWGLSGTGDTRDEAIRNLASNFNKAAAERTTPMPRPGANVPVEFASSMRVDEHPESAEDFIHRVLELEGLDFGRFQLMGFSSP